MWFGYAMQLEGSLLVVGAPLDDSNGIDRAGSAFIFILDQQTNDWIQVQKIIASDGAVTDHFGLSLALEGDTIAVSAVGRGDPSHGGVYMFELIDGVWTETQLLLPQNISEDDRGFGSALALDGDRMVVGAEDYDGSGRAFVFERDGNGVWQETATLEGAGDEGQSFGHSVDVLGDLIIVGAPFYRKDERGDFRVFRFDGSTWNVEGQTYENPPGVFEGIGQSVAIRESGNVILVGAREGDGPESLGAGSIRVFEFNGTLVRWVETGLFRPSDQDPDVVQGFAHNMAVDGDWLMVGAPLNNGGQYFYDLTGQLGTRSQLTDATVQFGTLLAGGLGTLTESEDVRFGIRSHFGFTAAQPNVADLLVGAQGQVASPDTMHLLIEARMTQGGVTMKVRLRNWNTNQFIQVHQYSIGTNEAVEQVMDIPSANYIRSTDDRIELSLRAVAMVIFSAQGFEEQTDFVNVLVRE